MLIIRRLFIVVLISLFSVTTLVSVMHAGETTLLARGITQEPPEVYWTPEIDIPIKREPIDLGEEEIGQGGKNWLWALVGVLLVGAAAGGGGGGGTSSGQKDGGVEVSW